MFGKKKPELEEPPMPPEPQAAPEAPPEPRPERRFTDGLNHPETVIGRQIQIRGDIEGGDSVEIAGQVDGNVTIRGLCRVRQGGALTGKLRAQYAVVEGRVEGKISVRRRAEIRRSGFVEADVRAQGVAIAEGGFFDGRIHMQGGKGRRGGGHHSFEEKRRTHK